MSLDQLKPAMVGWIVGACMAALTWCLVWHITSNDAKPLPYNLSDYDLGPSARATLIRRITNVAHCSDIESVQAAHRRMNELIQASGLTQNNYLEIRLTEYWSGGQSCGLGFLLRDVGQAVAETIERGK